ncbi:MAG: hypothetical protein QOJ59_1121 [Thermomicrobiales bacterium]|jgi:hypothetical protein|nr:hypothetical protein [Thermomicrobiales bacterium]
MRDLSGKWATDRAYRNSIVRRGNVIFSVLSNQANGGDNVALNMKKGLIPLPDIIDNIIDVSLRCDDDPFPGGGRGYDNLGPRTIRGLVLHRSQGTWSSNINHFESRCPGALTDIQVHHEDGRMMRFVKLARPRKSVNAPSGWANGKVLEPFGDGAAFIDKFGAETGLGADVANRDQESCEITGNFVQPGEPSSFEEPVSDACWATLAQWIASRAHDYGIPWNKFPDAPQDGFSFVRWHKEFTIGTGKVCPGQTVVDGTDALYDRVREIMKRAQTSEGARDDEVRDELRFESFPTVRVFHAHQGAVGRRGPARDEPVVKRFEADETISADGFFRGQRVDGDNRWLRTNGGERLSVHSGGVRESI